MNPLIMTREDVKTYLQITDTTYDNQIDVFLPQVSDFLVGRNGYLNNTYLLEGSADTTNLSPDLTNVTLDFDDLETEYTVDIANVPTGVTGAKISSLDSDNSTITLDNNATASATSQDLKVRNFPLGYKDIVANMVWYKIGNQTITKAATGGVKSERIEDYSITFPDSWSEKGQGGYPKDLLMGLETIRTPRFC